MKQWFFLCLIMLSYSLQAETFRLHKGLTSSKPWLSGVAKVSECVIRNEQFLNEVGNFTKYDFTTDTPKQVEKKIRDAITNNVSVELSTYSPKNIFTKSIAYRNKGSKIVYFNIRKNPRKTPEMINTTTHEWLHVVGYGHGGNSSSGKQNSVPYRVGSMAAKYINVCKGE